MPSLEEQIDKLAVAGLSLAPDRTIDELLLSFPRAAYEARPYELLLYRYAGEVEAKPYGRRFCPVAWNWDTACVTAPGCYVEVLREIEALTGAELFEELSDTAEYVTDSDEMAEIYYLMRGQAKFVGVNLEKKWADVFAVRGILSHMEETLGEGRHFYEGDNGQAILIYYLNQQTASGINELVEGFLKRMTS